jgi:putative redox protein
MKVACHWNEGMNFTAEADGQSISMDAKRPIGTGKGLTPKELVLAALCGCSAMDIAGLMRKNRQTMSSFDISAEATAKEGHPAIFKEVTISYVVKGEVESAKLIEAVELSQTKYCSGSAMISKASPIHFRVVLNEQEIHKGTAHFD